MESLANNRFGAIRFLLWQPELYGDPAWNGLMPQVLAAVLHHKVRVLRQLA